jgi:hypothetical protein
MGFGFGLLVGLGYAGGWTPLSGWGWPGVGGPVSDACRKMRNRPVQRIAAAGNGVVQGSNPPLLVRIDG